jgi:hypothetical protein
MKAILDVIQILIGKFSSVFAARGIRLGDSMTWFARLFRGSPPSPPTLDERVATLASGSEDRIEATALGNEEEGLRVAAVQRLPDGDALRSLCELPALPAAVERAAQSRMAELIDAGSVDFTEFCAQVKNPSVKLSVAALCKDAARLPRALASIDDPQQIAQLAVDSPHSRLRQLAAEAVEDPALLRQVLKQIRNKDKNVYRIVKQKCDALAAEERKAAEIAADISERCAALERHSHRSYDVHYVSTYEHLLARWRSLDSPPADSIEQRAKLAIDGCAGIIAAQARIAAQQAAALAAQRAAQEAQQHALHEADQAASARAEAEAQMRREAAAAAEAEEAARAQKRAAEELFFRQVGGLIRKAAGALSDGQTQRAAGLRRAVEEKLPAGPAIPSHLARQLQQLDDKLKALKEWKDYAVAPKRLELMEEMEGLIDSTEEPKVLAERIKSLQTEWRTISKGIVSETPADWERFHQASEAAYRPCREYFAAQARLRQENLENRKAVLERLTAFEAAEDGENPDWRLLARVLREAPQEWRRYFPVDREHNQTIQAQFDASMARLQSKLDAWHERNAADKQSLIQRARQLLTQEDSREAIESMKRLQILWKETGLAPREQDQSLWSEFRELCDAVYKKRQQAYADYTAALDASKANALALCEEVERVGALTAAALLEEGKKIPEWRSAFDALGEMPRADGHRLQERFERALDRCKDQMAKQQQRDAERSFVSLFEAGRRIHAYQWAAARATEESAREALKQAADTFIASVEDWPKGGLQAVQQTLANTDELSAGDETARERMLRMLCIRCEIRSETPTPAEDEALRREFQVQRLMQAMGQGTHAQDGDWEAMMLEWIRAGAISPSVHEGLQERFMRCWAKRPARSPPRSVFPPDDEAGHKVRENRQAQTRRPGREGSKFSSAR